MKSKSMTNFWKELGSVKSVYQEQIESLQKNNQFLTKNGTIYYRAKPKSKRLSNKQGYIAYKAISIILTVILAVISLIYVYKIKTIDYISPVGGKVNLDPLRFTNEELETFYNKHLKPSVAFASDGKDDIKLTIITASNKYGVDSNLLLKIAKCESGYRIDAKNGTSTASGLFQYIKGTWSGYVRKRGLDWTLADRFDAEKASDMTAYIISKGGLKNWDASKSCWGK